MAHDLIYNLNHKSKIRGGEVYLNEKSYGY